MRSLSIWLLALGLMASPAMGLDGNGDGNAKPVSQSEVQELRELIRAQAAQLEEQRRLLQQEHERVQALEQRLGTPAKDAATSAAVTPQPAAAQPEGPAKALVEKSATTAKAAPLSFKIGAAEFTPGGFADFSSVYRSTNVGTGIATGFGAIPYNNTAQGNLSEFRMSGQNSRISLRVDSTVAGNKVIGYVETDFWGTQPTSGYVTSNSNTLRMRMYMVDVSRNKWEVIAGQPWTLLTPNRRGLSPMPADLFITNNADSNYQAGLVWARQGAIRVIYHPTSSWAVGASLENPEQFTGAAVTLPNALNSILSSQLDNGGNTATPNAHPDFIAKVAHDQNLGGSRNWHFELAGLLTSIKTVTPNSLTAPTAWYTRTATGGGVSLNNIIDVTKTFRLVSTTFWSDGGGRYILGLGPNAVVKADLVNGAAIARPSLVRSGSAIAGFEWQANKNTVVSGYYSGAYFQRNAFADPTKPGSLAGFGFVGSAPSTNRAIQEVTFDIARTLWKDPIYGSLLWVTQTSYITRAPWYVPANAPKNAHLVQGFMELRYVLP